jgi:acyl phosphate:glycerol-3-phosphate acyltransferase
MLNVDMGCNVMTWAWVLLLAYACGSLSFAVLISKLMGLQDPRTFGSQNPGATNVLRSGNKLAAALTLIMDAFKGWLPVALFKSWGMAGVACTTDLDWSAWALGTQAWGLGLVGLAAFLGHLFPVFFKFKGGKGVATAFGVLLGFAPALGVGTLLCWVLVARLWRFSSLAALLSALFAPLFYWGMSPWAWPAQGDVLISCVLMSALLIMRHRANLGRLFRGEETRIGAK